MGGSAAKEFVAGMEVGQWIDGGEIFEMKRLPMNGGMIGKRIHQHEIAQHFLLGTQKTERTMARGTVAHDQDARRLMVHVAVYIAGLDNMQGGAHKGK
jgi:hypothetical protein